MTPETLAYMAGCIDCDGFITISPRRSTKPRPDGTTAVYRSWVAIVGLGQVTPEIPRLFQAAFGGVVQVYTYKNRPRSRNAYNWQVTNAAAARVAAAIRPYLHLKVEQADAVIAFATRVAPGRRMSEAEAAYREQLSQRIVSLNHGRRWNRRVEDVPA